MTAPQRMPGGTGRTSLDPPIEEKSGRPHPPEPLVPKGSTIAGSREVGTANLGYGSDTPGYSTGTLPKSAAGDDFGIRHTF